MSTLLSIENVLNIICEIEFACYKLKVPRENLFVILQSDIENLDNSRTISAEYVFIRKRRALELTLGTTFRSKVGPII